MPTSEADPSLSQTPTCPLCHTVLDPSNLQACPKCDWYAGYRKEREAPVGSGRDWTAVALSVIPGAGHLYKGHRLLGVLLLVGGGVAIFACGVAAFASAGWGAFLLPLYWIGVMIHAFLVDDVVPAPPVKKL